MEIGVKFQFLMKNLHNGVPSFLKEHFYFYAPRISLNNYEAVITLLDKISCKYENNVPKNTLIILGEEWNGDFH